MLFFCGGLLNAQQEERYFYEGFEGGSRPEHWTEEFVQGPAEEWRYRNGGHNPSDPENEKPPGEVDLARHPDKAYEGNYNAFFQKSSTNNETTKLVTPPINLEFALKPELRFWHAQMTWLWSGQSNHDVLRVYYKTSFEGEWVLLAEYLDPVEEWTEQIIPLPNPSPQYYIAFEAQTGRGFGVVIDEVEVWETEVVERYAGSLNVTQGSTDYVVAGTLNNEVLRLNARVFGNTGDLKLNTLTVTSLNTSDDDIPAGGVKLFRTASSQFYNAVQIGTASSFEGGVAVFENIDHIFNTGNNWFWVACDISDAAEQGNIIDFMLEAGSVIIGDQQLPLSDASPPGSRSVLEPVFHDNFDDDTGWQLTGEFEIAVPQGGGGAFGNPNPISAYNGIKILGTDLTGLGDFPYMYEPSLYDSVDFYYATSPPLDLFYYKDVMLRFRRWLNVHVFDGAFIEISNDGGDSWENVWSNNSSITDNVWEPVSYNISVLADRREEVMIRFGLGPTMDYNNFTGWNIDNFIITGEYITRDVGVTEWVGPSGDCGMSSGEAVQVRVENFAAIPVQDPVPVAYSLDGGLTWTQEEITATIPVGGSIVYTFETGADFSQPGLYPVVARTNYPGDQETANDAVSTEILSVPVHTPPYNEDFEGEEVMFWRPGGENSSWSHGEPAGVVINSAATGSSAWVTNLDGPYSGEESSYVEGPCFDFSDNLNPVFEMSAWWHTEGPDDYAAVMVSVDGRESWLLLGEEGEGDEYSWNWYNSPQGWTGSSGGWKTVRNHAPALAGENDVCFRVVFSSAAGEKEHEGFAFDGVSIYNVPPDVGVVAINNLDDGCAYTLPVPVEVEIMNYGIEALREGMEMVVGFDINGQNKFIEEFLLVDEVPAGTGFLYTFEGRADLSAEGEFELTAYTLLEDEIDFYNQNIFNDTTVLHLEFTPIPEVDLGRDIYTVLPDTVLLDAYAGIDGYFFEWQDGTTGPYYDVQEEGEYTVTVTDWTGCFAISSVNIVRLIADIGIAELVAPLSACGLGEEEQVTVKIENFGTDTLKTGSQFDIHISAGGGEPVAETVILEETLYPGAVKEYTFLQLFDFSEPGTYTLEVYTELENDNDSSNDLLVADFDVYGYPEVDLGGDMTLPAWEYELDAGAGFASYLWHDGSQQQTFTVTDTGQSIVSVTVTDENNCQTSDEVSITLQVLDIAIDSLLSPLTRCGAPEEAPVHVRVTNSGNIPVKSGTSIFLGYSVNEGAETIEEWVLGNDLAPGDTASFVFASTEVLEEGNWYNFSVFLQMEGDMRSENDTAGASIGIFEPPVVDLGPDIMVEVPEYTVDAGGGFEAYLWHDGSTGQEYTVRDLGINNISVTVTDQNNCTAYDTKQVLILVSDIGVSGIEIPEPVCSGAPGSIRVEISNYGNTNISTASTIYAAYSIDGATPVTERLILSSALGAGRTVYHDFEQEALFAEEGEYTIRAWTIYASDPVYENDTLSAEISVGRSPSPDIGGGENILTWSPLLLDAGSGYSSYLWNDGSTGQTLLVDSPSEGWYSVMVTAGNQCTGKDSVHVTWPEADLEMISVDGPPPACEAGDPGEVSIAIRNAGVYGLPEGDQVIFHYRINQGSTVTEEVELENGLAPEEIFEYTFSALARLGGPGTYEILAWLEYSRDGNAANNSATYTTEIYGYPGIDLAPGADTLFSGLPLTLDAGGGFASYNWQDGSAGRTYEVTDFGTFWVTVADHYGCEASDTVIVHSPVSSPALSGPDNQSLSVYPNPATDKLFVVIGGVAYTDEALITLVNLAGVTVHSMQATDAGRFAHEIDVGSLPRGNYILRVSLSGRYTSRMVVLR